MAENITTNHPEEQAIDFGALYDKYAVCWPITM